MLTRLAHGARADCATDCRRPTYVSPVNLPRPAARISRTNTVDKNTDTNRQLRRCLYVSASCACKRLTIGLRAINLIWWTFRNGGAPDAVRFAVKSS